jgi:hypothetical protein
MPAVASNLDTSSATNVPLDPATKEHVYLEKLYKTHQNPIVSQTVSIFAPNRRNIFIPIKIATLGTSRAYTPRAVG